MSDRARFSGSTEDVVAVIARAAKSPGFLPYGDGPQAPVDVPKLVRNKVMWQELHKLYPQLVFAKQFMHVVLTTLVERQGWQLEKSARDDFVKTCATRFLVQARHLNQARVKRRKWVAEFGFTEADADEAAPSEVEEKPAQDEAEAEAAAPGEAEATQQPEEADTAPQAEETQQPEQADTALEETQQPEEATQQEPKEAEAKQQPEEAEARQEPKQQPEQQLRRCRSSDALEAEAKAAEHEAAGFGFDPEQAKAWKDKDGAREYADDYEELPGGKVAAKWADGAKKELDMTWGLFQQLRGKPVATAAGTAATGTSSFQATSKEAGDRGDNHWALSKWGGR